MIEKYQYEASTDLETVPVNPLGKIAIEWSREKDDFKHGYSESSPTKISFVKEDFDWFYAIETSIDRCEYVTLHIHQYCAGVYIQDWKTLRLRMNAGQWDLDECKVTFTADPLDKYACYEDYKTEDFNIFTVLTRVTANVVASGTLESQTLTGDGSEQGMPPAGDGWTVTEFVSKRRVIFGTFTHITTWKRWNLGGGLYQNVLTHDPITTVTYEFDLGPVVVTTTVWDIFDAGNGGIDNGVPLKNIFEDLLAFSCPDLTLKSDFFQWNPENISTDNYVTGEPSLVMNLVMYQKSDVKRPDDANNATIGILDFEDLLNNICTMFNLRWDIDAGKFIIEHLSFWETLPGLDLTLPRYNTPGPKNYMRFKNKYSYNSDDMPKTEKFSFMEASNADFVGYPISYDSPCVSGDQEKEYSADIITTDLKYILDHPINNYDVNYDNKVSDEGFCLLALDASNNIINLPGFGGIFANAKPNNSLSWAWLHDKYYKHGRVLMQGYMNNQLTDFLSTIKTKIQENINIPLCCDDIFNPTDLIKTFLGDDGEVVKASYDINSEMLKLSLAFSGSQNIILTPVARNDSIVMPWNISVDKNVLANDSASAGIDATTVVITLAPVNGIASVNVDGSIHYTPFTDYFGSDILKYTFQDLLGATSNEATVFITVIRSCEGEAPVITDIIRNVDNSITITGTAFTGSTIKVYGSTDEFGSYAQINTDFTEADLVSGITISEADLLTYSWIKVRSTNDDCDFGFSNAFEAPAKFITRWIGEEETACCTEECGQLTGWKHYFWLIEVDGDGFPTGERKANSPCDPDYIDDVADCDTCPVDLELCDAINFTVAANALERTQGIGAYLNTDGYVKWNWDLSNSLDTFLRFAHAATEEGIRGHLYPAGPDVYGLLQVDDCSKVIGIRVTSNFNMKAVGDLSILTNLTSIIMFSNQFTAIPAFPAGITNLECNGNNITDTEISNALIMLDGLGLLNGNFNSTGQSPAAPPNAGGLTAKANLISKGWTVVTD